MTMYVLVIMKSSSEAIIQEHNVMSHKQYYGVTLQLTVIQIDSQSSEERGNANGVEEKKGDVRDYVEEAETQRQQ